MPNAERPWPADDVERRPLTGEQARLEAAGQTFGEVQKARDHKPADAAA